MRFKWYDEGSAEEKSDYCVAVTTGEIEDGFVGYVRQYRKNGPWVVIDCLSGPDLIPSYDKEFPTALQAMRVLRREIRIAIIGGAEP